MAEPVIELDTHNDGASAATYDIPIINGGTVDSTKNIRFGNEDSVSNTITDVLLNATDVDRWAPDLWLEDTDAADDQIHDDTMIPSVASGSQAFSHFQFGADAAFASNPILTCYDNNTGNTNAEEALDGTTARADITFVKITGAATSVQPALNWGEASEADLHNLETAGSVTLAVAAQGLSGDTAYMTLDVATGANRYFSLGLSLPFDATAGTPSAIALYFAIKYTYT